MVNRQRAEAALAQEQQRSSFQSELNYLRGLSDLNPTSIVSNPVHYQQFEPLEDVSVQKAIFDETRRQQQLSGGSQ
jgi:hypothetical protein